MLVGRGFCWREVGTYGIQRAEIQCRSHPCADDAGKGPTPKTSHAICIRTGDDGADGREECCGAVRLLEASLEEIGRLEQRCTQKTCGEAGEKVVFYNGVSLPTRVAKPG